MTDDKPADETINEAATVSVAPTVPPTSYCAANNGDLILVDNIEPNHSNYDGFSKAGIQGPHITNKNFIKKPDIIKAGLSLRCPDDWKPSKKWLKKRGK